MVPSSKRPQKYEMLKVTIRDIEEPICSGSVNTFPRATNKLNISRKRKTESNLNGVVQWRRGKGHEEQYFLGGYCADS